MGSTHVSRNRINQIIHWARATQMGSERVLNVLSSGTPSSRQHWVIIDQIDVSSREHCRNNLLDHCFAFAVDSEGS